MQAARPDGTLFYPVMCSGSFRTCMRKEGRKRLLPKKHTSSVPVQSCSEAKRPTPAYSPQVLSAPAIPQPYAHPGWVLHPERRLWSIFSCNLLSTAPWSSAHPKSDRSKPCHRCSPFRYTVLLRRSIAESQTKCDSVPKEPAVLQPITS